MQLKSVRHIVWGGLVLGLGLGVWGLSRFIVEGGSDPELRKRAFTGVRYELHSNGMPQRLSFFRAGKLVGTDRHWYPGGGLWIEARYSEGLPHGEHRQWYPDGRVKFVKTYVNGIEHGEFWGWHPNGQVSDFRLFRQGEEVSYKSWTFDGKPFYNYVYQNGERVGVQGGDFCKSRNYVLNR